ncbi:MAG: response regulator [Nitrospinae bacterium]|nr:response regulator [Nitrospinota bacterium]
MRKISDMPAQKTPKTETNLRLGEYLIQNIGISETELAKLLNMQKYLDDKIGEIAIREGYITKGVLDEVLEFQKKRGVSFGNAAIFLGHIKDSQVKHLLDVQAQEKNRIGELLVQRKFVTHEKLLALLHKFYSEKKVSFRILALVPKASGQEIQEALKPYKYQFHFSENREEFLPLAEKHKPQLILMDEDIVNAAEYAKKIKSSTAFGKCKLSVFSRKKEKMEMLSGYECGIDYILPVPFDTKNLVNIIIDTETGFKEKSGKRILVVDDSLSVRLSVAQELREGGFRVIFAENGKEGVEIASLEKPDLITMDINMPVMDGYQACLRLKSAEETRQIPVIILTSNNTMEEREKGFEVGAVEYFTKPFTKGHLQSYIKHLLIGKKEIRPEIILVAEDSFIDRGIFKDILNKYGFRFEIVGNGQEVLNILETGYKPSVILLECNMPVMDGFQTCKNLKGSDRYRHIPIIMLSAAKEKEDILRGLKVGADDYILKPFDGDELVARIMAHAKNYFLFIQLRESEEKQRRLKVEAESANKAKSIFLANMSHEIRTPMNAILGYAQLLKRESGLSKKQREEVGIIEKSGNHLLALINDILDISKIEAGRMDLKPRDFSLSGLLADLSAMFRIRCEGKGIEWRMEGMEDGKEIHAHGDEGKLRQVLINLLGNAVKFTESGHILLKITKKKKNLFLFEVTDTGAGISRESQEAVFEPFQQEEEGYKKGGTGLGLAISRKQVELMGGSLELKSDVGSGSRFFFTLSLPAAKEKVKPATAQGKKVVALAPGFRVKALVVDDSRVNRDVISKMLLEIGVEVEEAENGLVALEKARKNVPDIVFMDYRMPEMDGVKATWQIKKEFGDKVKTVMVTASAFDHEREIFEKAGSDEMLSKPFRVEDAFSCMARLLKLEYVYEEEGAKEEKVSKAIECDISRLKLPEALVSRIMKDTEFYKITDLQKSLEEMERIGPEQAKLAESLRDMANSYNMDGILRVLKKP